MRICIFTGPFFSVPPAPCGAVERIWLDIARELAGRGHDVTVVSRDADARARESEGLSLRYVRPAFRSSASLGVNLAKDAIYSLARSVAPPSADVYVTNAFWLPVLLGLRGLGRRVVVSVERAPKGQMRLYRRAGVRCLCAASRDIKEQILREDPLCHRIATSVPNPVDLRAFRSPVARRDFSGEREVLYMGRIHPEKGLEILVRAFAQCARDLPRTRLVLLGPWRTEDGGGGEAFRARLTEAADNAPVTFEEAIHDRDALAARLQRAHLFCYPSIAERGEAFGVAALEAMATGLVPVLSSLACFEEFLRPGINGFRFDHRAPQPEEELAQALRAAFADPERLHAMGERAARTAERFSVPRIAERFERLFERIAR